MKLPTAGATAPAEREVSVRAVSDLSVEVVSDSGEGAQKCGQIFGSVSAKMGNGVWTVEIIPAEVEPPPRNPAGASGIRIRLGDREVTNSGDETDLVVAFNEQALLGRHRLNALSPDAVILIENMWATHENPDVRRQWEEAMEELSGGTTRSSASPWRSSASPWWTAPARARTCSRSASCARCSTVTSSGPRTRSPTPSAERRPRLPSATTSSSTWATPGRRSTWTSATRSAPCRPAGPRW